MSSQTYTPAPHAGIDVKCIADGAIPIRVFFVFISYKQYPNKIYHKRFESFEKCKAYVQAYKDTIDGVMVIKEYVDVESLTFIKPKKKAKKAVKGKKK